MTKKLLVLLALIPLLTLAQTETVNGVERCKLEKLGMQLTQPSTTSCLPPLMMVVLGLGAVTIICSANR